MAILIDEQLREDARLRVLAARYLAAKRAPYMATIIYSLRIVETSPEELSTMAVDRRWRMYYSPYFVMQMPAEELATVLIHEAMHCMFRHNERLRDFPREEVDSDNERTTRALAWNLAGDCAINDIIDQQGMQFPELIPPVRFSDLEDSGAVAEQITETNMQLILRYLLEVQRAAAEGGDDESAARAVAHEGHDCGSASGGDPRSYEVPDTDAEAPAVDEMEQERIRDRCAVEIAARRGTVPVGVARWADAHLNPVIDWRKQLAVHVRASIANIAGRRDYTYMKPSRRQSALASTGSTVVLPAMCQPAPPRVTVVADTSGSIGTDELNRYVAELQGMVRAVGVRHGFQVIPCDYVAYAPIRIRNANDLQQINFQGGGGTNMCAGIAAALQGRPAPHIVVVLTDGFTPWPDVDPSPSTHFIVMLTDRRTLSEVPGWAKVVYVGDDTATATTGRAPRRLRRPRQMTP